MPRGRIEWLMEEMMEKKVMERMVLEGKKVAVNGCLWEGAVELLGRLR